MRTSTYEDDKGEQKSGRQVLDGPPKQPKLRDAPRRSKLSSLAGSGKSGKSGKSTPSLEDEDDDEINSPDGMSREEDDPEAGDLNSHTIAQQFQDLQRVEEALTRMTTRMPGLLAPIEDLRQMLRQLVPQYASAMLSGNTAGSASPVGAGAPSLASLAGGPSAMGPMPMAQGAGAGAPMGMAAPPGL